jgi:hypothetical protein
MLTVHTAATKFNLIDVSTVRAAMGIVDQSEDEAISGFIARASDVIARHCRRVFALETVTETVRIKHHLDDLMLARYPVVEIVMIVENGTALTAFDYEVKKESGIVTRLRNDQPTWWWSRKIEVTYRAGFELPDQAPEALKQAALQLVKAYYHSADRDPMVRSESIEALSSASYFASGEIGHLPPDVKSLLLQFKNMKAR